MTAEVFAGTEQRFHADLLQIWSRLLETTDLSIDDDFFDKGGDSLLATDLMLDLERLIGKPIPQSLLFEASTIRALTNRLIQAQELQLKPVVKIGVVASGESPLLFFHGDWTAGGFYIQYLARKLGPELPVIAIAPHGMQGQPVPQSVEAMAADRLPAIMEAQPQGPYRLGGHCVGAMVAFETARLLMASGHHVELVAMVEPPWIVNGEVAKMRRDPATLTGQRTAAFAIEVDANDVVPTPDMNTATDSAILERYRDALARYSPSPLSLPLMIFTSEFDGRPWCQLGRDCELFDVVGNHYVWITNRAYDFADRLKNRLQLIRAADDEQANG